MRNDKRGGWEFEAYHEVLPNKQTWFKDISKHTEMYATIDVLHFWKYND